MTTQELMKSEGYERHWNASDAKVVAALKCLNCGDRTLTYSGWKKPGLYRAFARCRNCGREDEI